MELLEKEPRELSQEREDRQKDGGGGEESRRERIA